MKKYILIPSISFHQDTGIKLKEMNDSIREIKNNINKYYHKKSIASVKAGEVYRIILELRVELEKLLFDETEKGCLSNHYKCSIYFGDINSEN